MHRIPFQSIPFRYFISLHSAADVSLMHVLENTLLHSGLCTRTLTRVIPTTDYTGFRVLLYADFTYSTSTRTEVALPTAHAAGEFVSQATVPTRHSEVSIRRESAWSAEAAGLRNTATNRRYLHCSFATKAQPSVNFKPGFFRENRALAVQKPSSSGCRCYAGRYIEWIGFLSAWPHGEGGKSDDPSEA
eukprot:scaffold60994_cov22-Prasinocladus_malaysianus.AAC.1